MARRLAWSSGEIKAGNYSKFRARTVADILAGLHGLTVGVVGLGVIGLAAAQAFHRAGTRIVYFDPAPRDAAAVDDYSTEPPDASNPLLDATGEGAQRLLLTPHIAGVTRQSSTFLFQSAWDNVERVLIQGQSALNRVY